VGKKLLAENISRTGVCVCVMTRWEPGVRQESFIQGVKMANLCGRKTPLLILSFVWCFSVSQGRDPCGHSSTRTFEGRFCRDSFFSTSPLNFFFFSYVKELKDRLKLVESQLRAGNNNPVVKSELKEIIQKLYLYNAISMNNGKAYLKQF
jgi:hypothetical protein